MYKRRAVLQKDADEDKLNRFSISYFEFIVHVFQPTLSHNLCDTSLR